LGPATNDIVWGSDGQLLNHPENKQFDAWLGKAIVGYHSTLSRTAMSRAVDFILCRVKKVGGRFLKQKTASKPCAQLSVHETSEHINGALRKIVGMAVNRSTKSTCLKKTDAEDANDELAALTQTGNIFTTYRGHPDFNKKHNFNDVVGSGGVYFDDPKLTHTGSPIKKRRIQEGGFATVSSFKKSDSERPPHIPNTEHHAELGDVLEAVKVMPDLMLNESLVEPCHGKRKRESGTALELDDSADPTSRKVRLSDSRRSAQPRTDTASLSSVNAPIAHPKQLKIVRNWITSKPRSKDLVVTRIDNEQSLSEKVRMSLDAHVVPFTNCPSLFFGFCVMGAKHGIMMHPSALDLQESKQKSSIAGFAGPALKRKAMRRIDEEGDLVYTELMVAIEVCFQMHAWSDSSSGTSY
jgi:hypothetical protein